ncbi:MAG: hypothetical protein WCJ60_02365 [bacterium]
MASVPSNYQQLTSSSGNVANASATSTLAAVAGRTTHITGFELTGTGATAGAAVLVTVTNVLGGTMTFVYAAATGVTVANTPLLVEFPEPIPATAVNTSIVVSCPALGAGNTNNAVVAHGYQL